MQNRKLQGKAVEEFDHGAKRASTEPEINSAESEIDLTGYSRRSIENSVRDAVGAIFLGFYGNSPKEKKHDMLCMCGSFELCALRDRFKATLPLTSGPYMTEKNA